MATRNREEIGSMPGVFQVLRHLSYRHLSHLLPSYHLCPPGPKRTGKEPGSQKRTL